MFGSAYYVAAGSITPTYQTSNYDLADLSTYTWTAQGFGAASGTRRVVVGFGWAAAAARTVSSITIGGVAATVDVFAASTSGNRAAGLASAVVPTGTTGDVVINLAGGVATRIGISIVTLNFGSPTGQSGSNGTSGSFATTTALGDLLVAFTLITYGASTTATLTWTGATEVGALHLPIDGTQDTYISIAVVSATTTSTTVDTTASTTPQYQARVAAAYR